MHQALYLLFTFALFEPGLAAAEDRRGESICGEPPSTNILGHLGPPERVGRQGVLVRQRSRTEAYRG